MAKLENFSGFVSFSAAAAAITLTTSRKLSRNFRYYKNQSETRHIQRDELTDLCRSIRQDAFGLQNLMLNESTASSPFLVSVSGQIYDQLEELHRKLLFFDAGLILEIIPLLDQQRRFWEHLTEPDFYSQTLLRELELNIPNTLQTLEKLINKLPVHATE